MRADLGDAGTVEDDDEIGHAHGGEAVRDQERDTPVGVLPTCTGGVALEERMFRLCVDRGRRLVEYEQERMVAYETACECQLLPLTEGNLHALRPSLAELRRETRDVGIRRDCKPLAGRTQIATVAIITAGRPRLLRRCLESLAVNCEVGGNRPRILVIDGSHEVRHRNANRRAAREIATGAALKVDYIGPVQARELRRRLIAAGLPPRTLRFGFTPGSTGANRNIALLMAGRSNLLMIDDDAICSPWSLREREPGVVIADTAELRDVRFFSTRPAALSVGRPVAVSLIDAHGDLLGARSRDVVSGALGEVTGVSPDGLRSAMARGAEYCVRVSFAGLAGDSGASCPHHWLFAIGALKDQLIADPAALATALRSREVIRIARRSIITRVPNCMALCMALTTDTLLPPFLPDGRNQDGLFGVMLHHIDPTALFGHLSYGIVHDSPRRSAYPASTIVSATTTRLANLIVSFSRRAPSRSGSPAARLANLADFLNEIAALPIREFMIRAMQVTLEDRTARHEALMERLSKDDSYSDYWRKAVDRYMDAFNASARHPEFYLPVEFKDRGSFDHAFGNVQKYVGEFADLLRCWAAIRAEIKSCTEVRRIFHRSSGDQE